MTTADHITTDPPLPPRVAWFAPWRWFAHWRPWKRWTLVVVVLLVGYLVSAIVVGPVLQRAMPNLPGPVEWSLNFVYIPIGFAAEFIPGVNWFYNTSFTAVDLVLDSWLGPQSVPVLFAPPPIPQRPPPGTPVP